MRLTLILSFISLLTLAQEKDCGYKFALDLKYEKGKMSYDGGFFNMKKVFCDTSSYESNSNYIVQITHNDKKYQKRVFINERVYNEKIKGSKVGIDNLDQRAIFRQIQFEFPKSYNEQEVTLRVSNLKNETLLKQKIKVSNK